MSLDFPNREDWLAYRKKQGPARRVLHTPKTDPKTGKTIPLTRGAPKVNGRAKKAVKKMRARNKRTLEFIQNLLKP